MTDDAAGQSGVSFRSALGRRALWRFFPVLVLGAITATRLTSDGPTVFNVTCVCLCAAFAVAMFAVVATTRYRIADGVLTVTSNFRKRRIPLARITAVRCLRAGPFYAIDDFAMGTAVVAIEESGWTTLVSPKLEREFLEVLGFADAVPSSRERSAHVVSLRSTRADVSSTWSNDD
ncbi:MAG: PH domain-containing protein [Gammaproteobacteria bacterium]|nr:PH domain-containing protein [Gammaproteobacteria bacterium]